MTEPKKEPKKTEVFSFEFKTKFPFEHRRKEYEGIKAKHATRIPVIIEKNKVDTTLSNIDQNKFLIPEDFDFAQCMTVIRKRLQLQPSSIIYVLFESGKIYSQDKKLKYIYEKEKDKDGFLYLIYSSENFAG